jgi:hypothetical protein
MRYSEAQRESGSGSLPKCHGSETLITRWICNTCRNNVFLKYKLTLPVAYTACGMTVIFVTDSGTVLTLSSTRVVKLVAASPVVQVYTPAAAGAARRISRSPVWCSTRVPEVLALLGSSQVASSPAPPQPSVTLAPEQDNLVP